MKRQNKKRILTGDRPTGPLHIGHYVGSLAQRVELQHTYETFILIADIQALTDNFENPKKVHENVIEVMLDYLSVGINPAVSTIAVQSAIPEIAELTILYMNLVSVGRLEQNPTVKIEIKEKAFGASLPVGFFAYPISQAADITAFGAHLVPVGEDQLPMIEQTREIVRKFNRLYGKTLIEPKELLSKFPRLPGTDGKVKMSKSLGNVINLSDASAIVKKKIRGMYTDPKRLRATDPGTVEGNPVFTYLDAFHTDEKEVSELKNRYRAGTIGDVEVKDRLAEVLHEFLEPIRKRRNEYADNMPRVTKLLRDGTDRAREVTNQTLQSVKKAVHIKYW